MAEKMANKRYGSVQFGRVHVHLPLHLLVRIRNHGLARNRSQSQRPRTPGSASHGDEWIDHARAVTAGPSAARPLGRVRRRLLRPARPLRSGAARHGSSPAERSTSGTWATASTTSAWWSPNWSPTRCGTRLPADTPARRAEQSPPVRLHLMRWTDAAGVRGARPQPTTSPVARRGGRTSRPSRAAGCSSWTPSATAGAGTRWPARCGGKVVWALFRLPHAPQPLPSE